MRSDVTFAFDSNATVWLCLTTLRHRRFVEDAIHVIGLPQGARVRLRYRRQYVDTSIWLAVSGGQTIGDIQILVALAGTTSSGQNLVHPLRVGHLVVARCEGDLMVLDVCILAFPYEADFAPCFANELNCIAPAIPKSYNCDSGAANLYLQRLRTPPGSLVTSSSVEVWEKVARGFFQVASDSSCGETVISDVPFLYFIQFVPSKIGRRLIESGRLDVETTRSVSLDVHTIVRDDSSAIIDPLGEILFDIAHVAASFVTSRHVRIDSRRDVRRVSLETGALFRHAFGHLSVRAVVFQRNLTALGSSSRDVRSMQSANDRTEIVCSRFDFPFKVGRVAPWVSSFLVSLSAAIVAFKVPERGEISFFVYVQSSIVFLIAFVGMALGLRGDSKR